METTTRTGRKKAALAKRPTTTRPTSAKTAAPITPAPAAPPTPTPKPAPLPEHERRDNLHAVKGRLPDGAVRRDLLRGKSNVERDVVRGRRDIHRHRVRGVLALEFAR